MSRAVLSSAPGRWVQTRLRRWRVRQEQAAIVASSDDAFVGTSPAGTITSWNLAAELLFGYPDHSVVGRPAAILFPPAGGAQYRAALHRAGTGESVRPYDTEARRGDGSLVAVAVAVSPIRRRGHVVGAVLGIRDITARQAAQAALAAGETRFRTVIETARNAFVAMDQEGWITDWNSRAEELFGWPRGEAIGRSLLETIVPPAERHAVAADLHRFLATGESDMVGQIVETTALRRDGTVLDVELSVSHLDDGGRHTFNAFVKDISERKRAEELQARVAAIVEASDEAIVGLGADLVVTHWNAGAEALYGYSAAEAVGRTADFLVAGGGSPVLLEAVAHGERVIGVETRVRRKDARVVPISLSAAPIVDAAGTVIGVSSVAHDITERRETAAALAAARDQALEASRLKSQFLATMSHEIRTPMNGVIGLTGLLLDTRLDALQRRYAEGIRNAGEALLSVISDILDFSKIEAGKLEIEAVDFDLATVVEEVAELVADGAREKGLEIITGVDPEAAVRFRGDANRIRQVLLNLMGNAVKFTLQGEVVIRAAVEGEHDGRTLVRFEISDTGIGIAPDRRARLFQPFSQADASTTRRFGGTGLGLAISAQLVEAMGGRLDLESEEGHGSRFWFVLPLRRPADGPVRRPLAGLLESVPVLVVDDNATNRLILETQLRSWGLRPRMADGGTEALRALAEAAKAGSRYGVVVTDHQMPDIDGAELARRISDDPATAGTPVILLTSDAGIDAATAADLHLAARLTKPVRQSDLYDVLVRIIAGPRFGTRPPEETADAQARSPWRGRVLVAEDNEINQMVALGVLAKLGYEGDVVGDGAAAVAAVAAHRYVAVLMDCHMPDVDGYQATMEIRARERPSGGHLPIIAMTAGVLSEDRDRAMAAGMDDYVAKPIDVDVLEAALARWTGAAEAGLPARPARPPDEPAPPEDTAKGAPALDPQRVDALRRLGPAGGYGLLPRLAESFRVEGPAVAAALRHLTLTGEAEAAREAAHRLRGTAANIGAGPVAALCAELETTAATGSLAGTGPIVERLEQEVRRACAALAVYTNGTTQAGVG